MTETTYRFTDTELRAALACYIEQQVAEGIPVQAAGMKALYIRSFFAHPAAASLLEPVEES